MLFSEFLFIFHKPADSCLQVFFHILIFLIPKLEYYIIILKMILNIKLNFLENFALYIFCYLLLLIPSFLQPFIESLVLTTHENNEIEIIYRKHIRAMKIEEKSSSRKIIIGTNVINQLFFAEFWNIKLLIPNIIKYVVSNKLANRNICKA